MSNAFSTLSLLRPIVLIRYLITTPFKIFDFVLIFPEQLYFLIECQGNSRFIFLAVLIISHIVRRAVLRICSMASVAPAIICQP